VIYYSFTDTEVIVIRVVHGSRDAAALFAAEE
jgi:plasmid stabilization system protein ParE